MNVGIGTEAALFHFLEYLLQISGISVLFAGPNPSPVHLFLEVWSNLKKEFKESPLLLFLYTFVCIRHKCAVCYIAWSFVNLRPFFISLLVMYTMCFLSWTQAKFNSKKFLLYCFYSLTGFCYLYLILFRLSYSPFFPLFNSLLCFLVTSKHLILAQ